MKKSVCFSFLVLASGIHPLACQTPTVAQFTASVNSAISALATGLDPSSPPIVLSANLLYANGAVVANVPESVLLNYVDGLKAAGAQRIDLNPAVTSINDPNERALYDAVVQHIRELGLQLSINPTVVVGELGKTPAFQDFQNMALQTYPQLAARYQPDNFVVVHEPTTMQARMGGLQAGIEDWRNFILAAGPLIKAKSPRTRLGAGGFQNGNAQLAPVSAMENNYFQDFAVNVPACSAAAAGAGCLDFMSMDIYNADTFTVYKDWAKLAHANGKGAYIAETWRPAYLPNPLPKDVLSPKGLLTQSLDDLSLMGAAAPQFADLNVSWLQAIANFAAANGLEAITVFSSPVFFWYGTDEHNKMSDGTYSTTVRKILSSQQAQLTSAGQAYLELSHKMGIRQAVSISSASYATFPNIFNPGCGSAADPCDPNSTVAPDALVSAFGTNLATTTDENGTFPIKLGGTTMTLVDSSNSTFQVPLYYVSASQVNYYVPASAAPGPAAVTITSGDGTESTGIVLIATVAPGIYTAASNGKGPAAAIAVCSGVCSGWPIRDGKFWQYTFAEGCTAESCQPQPLSVAPGDTVVLEIYGTGVRHLPSLSAISATIDGQNAPVLYAGDSGYKGEDQINVQIPRTLAGSGPVNLVLTVRDTVNNVSATSNTVTLNIQ